MRNNIPAEKNLPGQEYLNLILSSARMGTWNWNITTGAMLWDRQMHILFGIEPGIFGGTYRDFLERIQPADRERIASEIDAAIAACTDLESEFRIAIPADGLSRTIRIRSRIYCDVATKSQRLAGVMWDITERRRAEADLTHERNLFTALMDNLPENIYFKDLQSRFIAVNHSMALWHGFSDPEDVIGKSDLDLFSAEHAQGALDDEKQIIETGQPIIDQVEKETWFDGRVTWVSTTKVPLRDPAGNIIGTFGLSRDITTRKLAEEQLARITQELRAKNEALEEDLKMARELQNAMLPSRFPRLPRSAAVEQSAVQFYNFYKPSMSVSGDFFEAFEISDTMAGVFICDVMGHGVRAAMVAAIMRTLISELRYAWVDPGELLTQLNQNLRTTLKDSRIPMFASACYMAVDLQKGELRYANAGHPHPLIIRDGKPASLNGQKPGPALGLFDLAEYECSSSGIRPRDTVLLFTDGLIEVENSRGQLYEYGDLLNAAARFSALPGGELCDSLVGEIREFSADNKFNDDVCLIAMQVERLLK
jgi:sigma-B regulation protein RsbU (phosphoserine phosphatase)